MATHPDGERPRDPGSIGSLLATLVGADQTVMVVGPDDELVKILADEGRAAHPETSPGVDAVVLGQVLETSPHVEQTLRDAVGSLAPGGQMFLVVPHAAHGGRRLALLQGADNRLTEHRRAFTSDSLCDLAESVDLRIEELHATMRDPLDADVEVDADRLPASVVMWVRHQPRALEHTYVAVVRPGQAGEAGDRPEVLRTAPARSVRLEDEHLLRAHEERELKHRLLTLRDHVLGLEATTATAMSRAAEARQAARVAERRVRRHRQRLRRLTAELEDLREIQSAPRGVRRLVRRLRRRRSAEQAS